MTSTGALYSFGSALQSSSRRAMPGIHGRVFGGSGAAPSAPLVSNISPAANTPLSPADAVSFDVTDASGASDIRLRLIAVTYSDDQADEIAHDGFGFAPTYEDGSSVTEIEGGYHYSLVRAGGWPSDSLAVTPYVVSNEGVLGGEESD